MQRDEAVSEVIGTVLMIAMVVVLAGVVYVFVGHGETAAAGPTAIAMTPAGSTQSTRTFTIATTSLPIHWSELELKLNGAKMTYDDSLLIPASYCVVVTGDTCATTSAWAPEATLVKAGQQIVLHDAAISGKTLFIILPDENTAVVQVQLS